MCASSSTPKRGRGGVAQAGDEGGRGPKYSSIDGQSGSRYRGGHDHREGREENEILFNLQHQEEASVGSQAGCI